jgi:thymidylate synthase (FAD)
MEQQKIDIQVHEEPVHILAKADPLGDSISHVELIRVSGSDLDVVNAARVSYGKVASEISPRDQQLINYLVEHDHTSPFEHNQLSFRVKAPIFVIRQWMRHRMNSYNEISYRYVKSALEFYVPTVWRDQDHKNRQGSVGGAENPEYTQKFNNALGEITKIYEELLSLDVCREQSRGILPLCTYSEFIFTTNLHSLMHFIRLRTHPGAQYEIRVYAQAMLEMAEEHFPASIKAFKKKYSL